MGFKVILVQKCVLFRNDCWPTSNKTNDKLPCLLSQVSVGNDHHGWVWTHRHTRLEQGKNYIDLHFLVLCNLLSKNSCMSYQPTIFGERRVRLHQRMSARPGTVYSPSVKNKSPQDEKKGRSCQMFFFWGFFHSFIAAENIRSFLRHTNII